MRRQCLHVDVCFSQALKDIHTIEEVLRLEIQAISSSQLMFAT